MTNGPYQRPDAQQRPVTSRLSTTKNHHRCPMCLAKEIASEGFTLLSNGVLHHVRCISCYSTWDDEYAFVKIQIKSEGNT